MTSLPAWSNQSNVNTLTGAVSEENAERIMRVTLKRRYHPTSTLVSGLVGLYRMEHSLLNSTTVSVVDKSGNSNHGTPFGGITITTAGFIGSGLDSATLTGSYVQTPIQATHNFSVNCWAKQTSLPVTEATHRGFLFGVSQGTVSYLHAGISVASGTYNYLFGTGDTQTALFTTTSAQTSWAMYTMVVEAQTATLYRNASLIGFMVGNTITPAPTYRLRVGGSQLTTSTWYGQIDEVSVWNRVLSSTELTDLYGAGSGTLIPAHDLYDSSPITITSDVVSISDFQSGIDDEDYIQGTTRINSIDIVFNNSTRKYNPRHDSLASLWADGSRSYYIHDSLLDVEMGYKLQTGTSFYKTILSGLIKNETVEYDATAHTMKCSIVSKLDVLKRLNLVDILNPGVSLAGLGTSIIDAIFEEIKTSSPPDLSITTLANSLRKELPIDNITQFNQDGFEIISSIVNQTGSLFGITKNNELFVSYFGNTANQSIYSRLPQDSNTTHFYSCLNESITTDNMLDEISTTAISISGTNVISMTAGKFGRARVVGNSVNTSGVGYLNLSFPAMTNGYSMEYVARIRRSGANSSDSPDFRLYQTTLTYHNIFSQKNARFGNDYFVINEDVGANDGIYYPATIGENQWFYVAGVNDNSGSGSRKIYLNGHLFATLSGSANSTQPIVSFAASEESKIYEIDHVRFSNIARDASQCAISAGYIFGNNINLQTTKLSSWDFYNFGGLANIYQLNDYNDGLNKIINKVSVVPMDNTYKTTFSMSFTTFCQVDFYFGGELHRTSITALSSLSSFFDNIAGVFCTVTGNIIEINIYEQHL